jgi:hypothetical protein
MTENSYNCEYCNYHTTNRSNYNKHLLTIKHQKSTKSAHCSSQKNTFGSQLAHLLSNIEKEKITNLNNFSCIFCQYTTKKDCNLQRHYKTCKFKKIKELENINNELNIQIISMQKINNNHIFKNTNLLSQFNKLQKELKEKDNELEKERIEKKNLILNHHLEIKNLEIEYLKKNEKQLTLNNSNNANNTNIVNITNYITKKYANAPNLETPEEIYNIEDIQKYIENNNINEGYSNMIYDLFCKGKLPEERSLWCVDPSRNKYLTKLNNTWNIDLDGKKFNKYTKLKIYHILYSFQQKINNEPKNADILLKYNIFLQSVLARKLLPKEIQSTLLFDKNKHIIK